MTLHDTSPPPGTGRERRRSRRLPTVGLTLSVAACLLLTITTAAGAAPAQSAGTDSDGDGIEDRVERYLELDPASADSDGDGVLDQLDVAALSSRQALMVNPTTDTDSDGIADFLEIYGYYVDGATIRGQKRLVPAEAWEAFKQRPPVGVGAWPAHLWAATAIEEEGYLVESSTPGVLLLDIANTYQVIREEFLSQGLSSNHLLIAGSARDEGTIASIMAEFVTVYDPAEPIIDGEPQPVYHTDHLLRSSDWDPHSDRQEVLGTFEATTPRTPADHPLIGGIPNISTAVDSFSIVEIKEQRTVDGTSTNHQTIDIDTRTKSRSHGFTVGVELGAEFEAGFTGPSAKKTFKFSASHNSTWSTAITTGTNTATSFGTIQQTAEITSLNCYSKLQLNLRVTNDGSERASAVKPKWYIDIGGTLWQTVTSGDYVGSGLSLSAGASDTVTILGQPAGDAGCLTLDQTNYLANGGSIGISTELESAAVPYLDQDTGIINTQGNWADYLPNYEENLTRVDLNVFTTTGREIDRTLWVRGFDEADELPDMKMSIRQALEQAYPAISCSSIGQTDGSTCLRTPRDGNIVLDEDTLLDFLFFDENGDLLDFEDSHDVYASLTADGESRLDVVMPPRSSVSIVDLTSRVPEFGNIEAITRKDETTGTDTLEVRASVFDYFGIESVEFCRAEGDCEPMKYALDPEDPDESEGSLLPINNGFFKLEIENYSLQGTEFLRARNIRELETVQNPRTFYLNLIGTHYDAVTDFNADIEEKNRWLGYLAAIRLTDPELHQEIVNLQIMDDENTATQLLNTLRTSLSAAKEACSFTNPIAHSEPNGLVAQYDSCVQAINTHDQAIEDNPIRIYNPYKIPAKNVLTPVDLGLSNSGSGEVKCELPDTAVVTGVDISYDAGIGASPGIRLYYRTMVRTGLVDQPLTWSSLQNKACGKVGSGEKRWSDTRNQLVNGELTALVDFGWSVQRGNVTRLCVVTRTFDINTLSFSTEWEDNCTDGSWRDTEAFSASTSLRPDGSSGPATYALQDVWINAKYEAAQATRARHFTYGLQYQQVPANDLVPGGQYVIRSSDGRALTLAGTQSASRQIVLSPFTGADGQIWVAEAVNDREFRLQPLVYDGYLRRNHATGAVGDTTFVAATATTDETGADFNEHWRLTRQSDGRYSVTSAASLRNLSSTGLTLAAPSSGATDQRWTFQATDGSGS